MFDEIRQKYFPFEIIPGVRAVPIADRSAFFQQAGPLMDEVFQPFTEIGAFALPHERWAEGKALRQVFSQTHLEHLLFMMDEQPIGWSNGEMIDSMTFFMSSSGILPAYQRRGIYSAFLRQLLSYLAALGYERVVSNHQTNNRAVIIAKLKAGFNVTAVTLDERWGAQVQLTYLFDADRRSGYERAFALESRPAPFSHSES